jgi:NAD(P)-dependent dehydrogenase (short-subunit alcohol dehydrogenase family)
MADRVIIVTGGYGALGRAVAAAFTTQGDTVVRVDSMPDATDPNPSGLDIGGVDLTDAEAAKTVVETVRTRFGSFHALINIAGGFIWETLADGAPETWQRMFAMNVITATTMSRAALPALIAASHGRIVNIGANAAIRAEAGMGPYAASKAAVHRMTEALATELAPTTVTVNAVLPSIIDTPANRADMPGADFAAWVQPQAIADVILFLASPAARSVNGALIPVTRGATPN